MIEVKCVDKKRDKSGKITDYKLVDKQGVIKILSSGELKEMIHKGLISVVNLTLTSDGRLIEKQIKPKPTKTRVKSCVDIVKEIKADVKAKGGKYKVVKDGKDYQVINVTYPISATYPHGSEEFLVIIKDSATKVPSLKAGIFKNQTVRLIGGKNLKSTYSMLRGCGASCIDVTLLNTSNVTDMSYMFFTEGVIEPDTCVIKGIENLDTHKVENMIGMFMRCKTENINLSNFDTSKVINMRDMFTYCRTKTLDLSSFDTSNVVNMEGMFTGCKTKTLDLSSFNTGNVVEMEFMFQDCEVEVLNLSNFNTSNVTSMYCMFEACKTKVLDLSSFNTSKVVNMGGMFEGCETQTLDLSNFDTSNVVDMEAMFANCKTPTLDLSNFDTHNVKKMKSMFLHCGAETINLSSFDTSNVDDMSWMFGDCLAKVIAKDQRILNLINKANK